jgi:alkyl hydroperoxide reductase subunit D
MPAVFLVSDTHFGHAGVCHFCVKAHYDTLKQEGYSVEQLRDIGRIASVINSVAKVLNS